MTETREFRPVKENELPLVWNAIRSKAIFPGFSALIAFHQNDPGAIQIKPDDFSCLGLVGPWRQHLKIGAIKILIAPDLYRKRFLHHLVSSLRAGGFDEIVSPPLRLWESADFYRAGFRKFERILVLRKGGLRRLPEIDEGPGEVGPFEWPLLPDLERIEQSAFSDFWRWEKEELEEAVKAGSCNVVFLKGTAIGYNITTIRSGLGTIARLAVLPKFQRKGFGSQLLIHALRLLEDQKARSALITTQSSNQAAQNLYGKFGFRLMDEERLILKLER
jgi:ribosomal-protein-alanine N-acetyltransferase